MNLTYEDNCIKLILIQAVNNSNTQLFSNTFASHPRDQETAAATIAAEEEMARAATVAIREQSTNAAAAEQAGWDIILNDPITHSSSHPGTKAFGEYIRARYSHFKYYKMDNRSRSELENNTIKNLVEYFRGNGRFLIEQGNKFRLANDNEVISNIKEWFSLEDDNVPVFGSSLVEDFLGQHKYLNKESAEFLDDLFLSDFREPWKPGKGFCVSSDAAYNMHHQMNFHRPAYIRQNYSRTDTSQKTGNSNTVYRWTYGTGCGLTTHGIPKW
jgi:hypothetical protein